MKRAGVLAGVAALVVGLVASGVVQADEVEGSSGVEAVAFAAAPAPVTFSVGFQRNSVTLSAAGKAKISDFLDNLPAGSTVESVQVTGRADTRCRDLPRVRGDVCAWRAVAGQRARSVVKYMRSLEVTAPIIRQVRGVNGRGADARRATVVITLTQAPTPPVPTQVIGFNNGTGIGAPGDPVEAAALTDVTFSYPCLDGSEVVSCEEVVTADPVTGLRSVGREAAFTNGVAIVTVTFEAQGIAAFPGLYYSYAGTPGCVPQFTDGSTANISMTCTVPLDSPTVGVFLSLA